MHKKLLAAGIGAVAVAGLIGGGTFAQFQDAETSANNTIAAGTLDFELVPEGYPEYLPFSVTNVKPGDSSAGDTRYIHMRNNGSLPGVLSVTVVKTSDDDNGCADPEDDVDATCGAGEGELAENLRISIDGIGSMQNVLLSDLDGVVTTDPYNPMLAGEEQWYSVSWSIDSSVGNEIQSDSTGFQLEFSLVQAP